MSRPRSEAVTSRGVGPLLAALVLVVAGCSSAPVDDRTTPAPVETPAPVPTEDLPADRIAPGVSLDGIEDAERLAAAHDSYLANRSYAKTSGTRYLFENGSLLYLTTHNRTVDRERGRQLVVRERWGNPDAKLHRPNTSYAEWRNATVAAERTVRGRSVRYHARERRTRGQPSHGGSVAMFVAAHDPEVVGKRTTGGMTEYVLVARNVSQVRLLDRLDADMTAAPRLVAVVTAAGLVREVRLSARGRYDGTPVRAVYHVRYGDVGTATVDRPSWLADALAETGGVTGPGEEPTRDAGTPTRPTTGSDG